MMKIPTFFTNFIYVFPFSILHSVSLNFSRLELQGDCFGLFHISFLENKIYVDVIRVPVGRYVKS